MRAITATSTNSTVFVDLLRDDELALQLAKLRLNPTYRDEISLLANSTDINIGKQGCSWSSSIVIHHHVCFVVAGVQISQYAAQILDQSASVSFDIRQHERPTAHVLFCA